MKRQLEEKPFVGPKVGVGEVQKLGMPVEGFRNHVATGGFLLGANKMGAKNKNAKKGMEVAKRHRDAPFK